MADSTQQFRCIQTIASNLAAIFADDPQVFVAGNLLWYPVEKDLQVCIAPSILVAFGVPKGDRVSYQQWREGGIAPQVVFEIWSQHISAMDILRNQDFCRVHGTEEYYAYNPETHDLAVVVQTPKKELEILSNEEAQNWVSPRLGIRLQVDEETLTLFGPDGRPFSTLTEERQRAEQERQRADQERDRADCLAARLREMGIDPDEIAQ